MRYHKSLRLEKARELLEDSTMNIKQILLNVGYQDQRQFFRDFKDHFGVTPSQYKARHAAGVLTAEARPKEKQ